MEVKRPIIIDNEIEILHKTRTCCINQANGICTQTEKCVDCNYFVMSHHIVGALDSAMDALKSKQAQMAASTEVFSTLEEITEAPKRTITININLGGN